MSKGRKSAQESSGTEKPEAKDTTQTSADLDEGKTQASSEQVEAQREAEQQEALEAAKEAGDGGEASPSEKGAQTKAAKDVREQAATDAEARAQADAEANGGDEDDAEQSGGDPEDPVQAQRREEAEARAQAEAERNKVSEEEARLLGAAPGGQRTALTKGREGSTTVSHTAASPRPASGPLDAPQAGVENLAATDDDPDNRVYADEAGPRPEAEEVTSDSEFVDAEGNAMSYSDIFDDSDASKTFVTTKTRVYEEFTFPNTDTRGRRLAYAAGRRVARGEAENVKRRIG